MINAIAEQIGIIACPGGASLALRLCSELEHVAQKKFRRKVQLLSEKYQISDTELLNRINLGIDMRPTTLNMNLSVDEYRKSSFRIPVHFTRFANGEFKTEICSTVRNMDVYIIQDVENHYPMAMDNRPEEKFVLSVNDHVFCLLVTIDAALQAGAKRVTVVLPTYPYSRQHKKKGREGLTAARMGQILEHSGVSRLITLDLHSKEIENCFTNLRLENLHASYQILRALSSVVDLKNPDLVIISPDTGSVDRNKFYATALGKPLGLIYKERDYSRTSTSAADNNIINIHLLGNVEGKTVFMADDLLGTGGTLLKAMASLKDHGAQGIICAVSLPLFSATAVDHFDKAYRNGLFHRLIGTNAVYHEDILLGKEWYLSADITHLFARAIYRVHANRSLSSLMDNRKIIQDMLKQNSNTKTEEDNLE